MVRVAGWHLAFAVYFEDCYYERSEEPGFLLPCSDEWKSRFSGLKSLVVTRENIELMTARLKPCPDTKHSYTKQA